MNRNKAKGELVSFRNTKNYLLDGIFYQANKSTNTIIHVHGSYGNFYQNHFLRYMGKYYPEVGYNFLSFNLRSHDGFAEGYQNVDDFEYVGGAVSEYDTYLLDLNGAIDFVRPFSNRIILQGHSMGCDKIVGYMLERQETYDCILLSPSDSYMLQTNWLKQHFGISVEEQTTQLKQRITSISEDDFDWLPIKSYGAYYADDEHFLPITSKALYSILTGVSFWAFNLSKSSNYFVDSNCFVYLGEKDELQTSNSDTMLQYIQKRFNSVESLVIKEAEHMLNNVEEKVCHEIIKWLLSIENA